MSACGSLLAVGMSDGNAHVLRWGTHPEVSVCVAGSPAGPIPPHACAPARAAQPVWSCSAVDGPTEGQWLACTDSCRSLLSVQGGTAALFSVFDAASAPCGSSVMPNVSLSVPAPDSTCVDMAGDGSVVVVGTTAATVRVQCSWWDPPEDGDV